MAKLIRVLYNEQAHTDDAQQRRLRPSPEATPTVAETPAIPETRTEATPMAWLSQVSFAAGKQLWQRPAGRHGRHARGSDVRSGSAPSLSIRSAEVRNWSADLSGPGPAGLVVYGLDGIGKSTLAVQIATRVSRLRSGHVVTTLSGEVSAASFPANPTATDFVILDNFDDNLTEQAVGWTVRDPLLAALLASWPGKLLVTCRRPFALGHPASIPPPTLPTPPTPEAPAAGGPAAAATSRPALPAGVLPMVPAPRQSASHSPNQKPPNQKPLGQKPLGHEPLGHEPPGHEPPGQGPLSQASVPSARARVGRDRLVFRRLGPLTRSSAWEIMASLPAIRLRPDAERDYLWRLTAGHSRALEDLDSVLAQGALFSDLADRIEAMVKVRSGQPLPRTEPTAWPDATVAMIASASGDQLIGELFGRLGAGARTLLVRTSVFRVPVGSDALAARPGQVSEVQAAGLLAVGSDGNLSVHRWTADRLHRHLAEAGQGAQVLAAHEQAARYWRSRAAGGPAGERADLEAASHERQATVASTAVNTARQFGPPTTTRRRRVIGISVASAICAGAVVTAVLAIQATQGAGAAHLPATDVVAAATAPVTQAALARGHAATWAAQQVSGGAIMACDPAMCAVLAKHGVAAGNLLELGPAALDPLGSEIVFATAAVRSMFGGRLASVYAPEILASFGSGQARIDVRVVAPDGAAAYRIALAADLAARRTAGAQLLRNPRIMFSVSARAQLLAGQVDARLLITLDPLAASQPVRVVAFLADGPGASPGLPLRAAQLSAAAPAPAQRILAFFQAQRPPYLVARAALTSSSGVTVEFAAPTPLGLLQPSS